MPSPTPSDVRGAARTVRASAPGPPPDRDLSHVVRSGYQHAVSTARAPWRLAVLVGLLVTAAAWAWMSHLTPRSTIYSIDLYFLFYPAHLRFGEEIAGGRLPVWNPDLGLGINELADSQFGFLYPPNLLFAALPTALAMDVLAWSHVVLATGAVWLLCLTCGLSPSSAAVAAAALGCGSALHALAGWTTMLATFAWAPAAFLAARRLADSPGWSRAVPLAIVLALQLLAGYLQFSLYTAALIPLFIGLSGSAEADRPRRLVSAVAWTTLAGTLALGLAAAGVLPALAAVPESLRDPKNIPEWFYELVPVRLGDYPAGLSAPALDARIPAHAGVLVPLLAIGALVTRGSGDRLRTPALALTAISFVLSLGKQTPIYPLLWKLPIGHLLTHPHKWVYFFSLGLALLAACGTESARRSPDVRERVAWLAAGIALLVIVPFATAARAVGMLVLLALTLAPQRWRHALVLALPLVVVLVTLPAYRERAQRPSDNLNYLLRYDDAYEWLATHRNEGRTFVLTPDLSGSPRQGEIHRVPQVTSNGTFLSARLDRYMRATRDAATAGDAPRAAALLSASGSRFVMTGRGKLPWLAEQGAERAFTGEASDVWELRGAAPRAYLSRRSVVVPAANVIDTIATSPIPNEPGVVLETEDGPLDAAPPDDADPGEARIVESTDRVVRIQVDAARPAVMVLLDSWSTEWHATIDGSAVPTRKANSIARAVEVPAGRHEVVFRFAPRSLRLGGVLSLLSGLLLAAVSVARSRRGRRTAT